MLKLAAGLMMLALPACASATTLLPARAQQAAQVLTTQDEYFDAMTPADLSVRLALAEGATLAALRDRYGAGALDWSAADKERLAAMAKRHKASLLALRRWLPAQVLLLRASSDVEGGLPHTRGTAISFGAALPPSDGELDWLFFHELFHVLSRHNASKRDGLYALIGFEPCAQLQAPESLTAARITNPDAVATRHVVPVSGVEGANWLLPYLFARPARFDPAVGSRFTAYFNVAFAAVERDKDGGCTVRQSNGAPVLFSFPQVRSALFEKTGANTSYVMHPEETLADNFADLMTGRHAVPNPEVQQRLADFLGLTEP